MLPSMDNAPTVSGRQNTMNLRDLLLCVILLAIAAVVFGKGITVGGPRGDAGSRVMDGVLIHDWVCAGPSAWIDPVGFAERQYSYYPSLGIGSAYPPGFAVAEAVFFAIFGVSVVTARLCVLTFALLATSGFFILARQFTGRLQSSCAVLSLIAMPSVVYWTRQTMLEMPTLALLIWSALAACHYHKRPNWLRLALWVGLSVGSVMFKQTALFVFLPHAVLLVVWTIGRRAPVWHLLAAGSVSISVLAIYFVLISSGGDGPHVFDLVLKGRSPWSMFSASSWLTYALWAPGQMGLWIILSSIMGLALMLRRPDPLAALTLLWFISFYVMSSLIQHKEPRYLFFGLLPFAVWSGMGIAWLAAWLSRFRLRAAVATCFGLVVMLTALRQPIDYRPDYGPLVLAHRDLIAGRVVLFDGLRDADFIVAVRQHLGPRRAVVVRGSKLLYACAAKPQYRFHSYVSSTSDVKTLLRDFAFDGIVVERRPVMNLREERMLRESLANSEDYELAASHLMTSGPTAPPSCMTNVDVDVYVPRRAIQRAVRNYDIPIPLDNRTISVSLRRLLADIKSST